MSKFIEKVNKEIEDCNKKIMELNKLLVLKEQYPDLDEQSNRWNNTFYTSSHINKIANEVEFKYSCGCCNDAPLLAYFYTVVDDIRIYSSPFCIAVAEQNINGYGDFPYDNWRELLEDYNINPNLFEKVQLYLDNHPPVDYDEDEDD